MRQLTAACALALALTACSPSGETDPEAAAPSPSVEASAEPTDAERASPSAAPPGDGGPTASPSPPAAETTQPTPAVDGPLARDVLAATPSEDPLRFEVALRDGESPAELVMVITASEEAVRDDSLSQDARLVAAHRGQRAYRQLGRREDWQPQVLDALPERWQPIAVGNVAAREALDRLVGAGEPPTTLPAWEIVEPAPADELLQYYREAEDEIGADWELLAAINLVETRMGRIVGFSTAQARGPMQFIPASWEAFGAGGDIDDPRDSILAAARHLTQRPGDPPTDRNALLNYNRSSDYGDAVLAIADVLRQDPSAYRSYHGWQVYYNTPQGEFLLPVGYRESERVPIEVYLARDAIDVVA